jgi:hypothetical protein
MKPHKFAIASAAAALITAGLGAGLTGVANADPQTPQRICIVYGQADGSSNSGGQQISTTHTQCYGGVAAYVNGVTRGHESVPDSATLHEANQRINDYMASPNTIDSSTVVGYGCDGTSFTSTCWNFAVSGTTGCSGGTSWHWATLYPMDNKLSSWTAEANCSYGILYDLPYEPSGSVKITCYTCYSLGSMDNKASSLGIYP